MKCLKNFHSSNFLTTFLVCKPFIIRKVFCISKADVNIFRNFYYALTYKNKFPLVCVICMFTCVSRRILHPIINQIMKSTKLLSRFISRKNSFIWYQELILLLKIIREIPALIILGKIYFLLISESKFFFMK